MLCLATWSTDVHASTLSWLQRWRKGARFQDGRCLEIVGRSRFVRQSHGIVWGSVPDKWVAILASVDLATSPTSWRTRREAYCSRVRNVLRRYCKRLLTLLARMRQGLCNGTMSVRLSVSFARCHIARRARISFHSHGSELHIVVASGGFNFL